MPSSTNVSNLDNIIPGLLFETMKICNRCKSYTMPQKNLFLTFENFQKC